MSAERADDLTHYMQACSRLKAELADAQRYEQDLKRSLAEQSRGRIEAEQRAAALSAELEAMRARHGE